MMNIFVLLKLIKIYPISIKKGLFIVAVGSDVYVARTSILGFSVLIRVGSALFDDFVLLLSEFFGHFVKVQAVDFGVMGRLSALEGVDGRSLHAVLDVFQSGSPK